MKKYISHFEQVISYDIEISANTKEEAIEKAKEIITLKNHKIDKQIGYIEYCYTDEEENEDE